VIGVKRGAWLFLLLAAPASGQQAATPATRVLQRYREVLALAPLPDHGGTVQNLVIERRNGRLTLTRGVLYFLSPVGGRTVGAVFQGEGRFAFDPIDPTERAELARLLGSATLDEAITDAVLLFADSTATELVLTTPARGDVPGAFGERVADVVGSLRGDNEGSFSPDLMGPLLNGETNGFFLVRVERRGGSPLLYRLNPDLNEVEQLYRKVGGVQWGDIEWAAVSQSPPGADAETWWHRRRLDVPHYAIDVRLRSTTTGELDFAARATLSLAAVEPVGPWLHFALDPKLEVDSARWGDGSPAAAFKAEDDTVLWVRAGQRLGAGDTLSLTLFYGGDLIDRYGDWFFVDPGADWYPVNGQGGNLATFDLTFRSPSRYPLASIGERVDSVVQDRELTTRWVDRRPTPYASFNLGIFETERVAADSVPPIDVLISEQAHREMRQSAMQQGIMIPQQRNMRKAVVTDVTNSLKVFTNLFGDAPFRHYFVTEIPYLHGIAFPGLIHLSWSTFQQTSGDGFDQFFRAHEVAHQWWGNAVRPGSYRDAWLSEGLATFSGLWYLQQMQKRNDTYFDFLDEYRTNLGDYRGDVGPIWVGHRSITPETPLGYQVMIYEKGAWVFHMLRALMLDLGTRSEARFTALLRGFHETFRGRRVTTADFQRFVEQHAGVPMDWFFDAWIRGTAIPTYRVAWKVEPADGKYRVRLRVTQEGVPPEFRQFVLVSANLGNDRFAHFRVGVHGGQTEYLSPLLPSEPRGINFNELHSVLAEVKTERW
jgi:hypothetical protein